MVISKFVFKLTNFDVFSRKMKKLETQIIEPDVSLRPNIM